MLFEPDEQLDSIFTREAANDTVAVLVDAGKQVRGHAGVKRAVSLRGQEIDRGLKVLVHFVCLAGFPPSRE